MLRDRAMRIISQNVFMYHQSAIVYQFRSNNRAASAAALRQISPIITHFSSLPFLVYKILSRIRPFELAKRLYSATPFVRPKSSHPRRSTERTSAAAALVPMCFLCNAQCTCSQHRCLHCYRRFTVTISDSCTCPCCRQRLFNSRLTACIRPVIKIKCQSFYKALKDMLPRERKIVKICVIDEATGL